ncbi:MAG TPA: methyltransferase domain-containing protein [Candidatus Angelobacter sp.]|nr:methyltransferase domain-containing protein [Candidatus Angelobacter sp.]
MAIRARRPSGLVLNLGCKETRLGDINVDIRGRPDIRASALYLPFKTSAFSLILFSEVLEHLPRNTESRALREIRRVTIEDGLLILSTPSAEGFWGKVYWFSDPAFWLIDHRHYTIARLMELLEEGRFETEMMTIRGGPRDMLFSLVTPFSYLVNKLVPLRHLEIPSDYASENAKRGYTLIAQAR